MTNDVTIDRDTVFSLGRKPPSSLGGRLVGLAKPPLERVLGLRQMTDLYHQMPVDIDVDEFLHRALEILGIRVAVTDRDLEQVPRSGPVVVVANHPFGGIEGVALALLLREMRSDIKVMGNYLLDRIPELRGLFLLVDPFETVRSVSRNLAPLRQAIRWLEDGGLLVVFPAGEVAHFDLARRRVADPPWSTTIARIIRRVRCPVVPVHFTGRNGALFQLLGLFHPDLRTALLPRELLKRRSRTIEVRIGTPVSFRRLAVCGEDQELIAYLRQRSEILAQRRSEAGRAAKTPVQPRRTPVRVRPIAPPVDVDALAADVAGLGPEALLTETRDQAVYLAAADQIPNLLPEIGRLREITFREVGEGTGRELDLDPFDQTYLHLFIWNRERREVVGAYRLASSREILAEQGPEGLYTSSLFRFDRQLFAAMGPALEMGRSFVRPEYQRNHLGLMLLWKGIGCYVLRHPDAPTLFGPVSISAEYLSVSQQLIVTFLKENDYVHEWSRWVRPRIRFKPRRRGKRGRGRRPPRPANLRDLEEVSAFIAEIEADGKGVPILLKQYLKLGGRLLGFNVDPAFSNVLDVLIMVDLRQTEPRILTRYMGREEAEQFLAHHGCATLGDDDAPH